MAVPAEFRAPIRRYAPRLKGLAKSRYGISPEALLAKLAQGESGWSPTAKSGAGAREEFQFMPGTRASFLKEFGVDAYGSPDEKVHAAVLHLLGAGGHSKGLEGYNPGGGQDYVHYILGQKVGNVRKQIGGARGRSTPESPTHEMNVAGGGAAGLAPTAEPGGDGLAALLAAARPAVPQSGPAPAANPYVHVPQGYQAPSAPPQEQAAGISELLAASRTRGPDGLPQPEAGPDYFPDENPQPNPIRGRDRTYGGSISFAPGADRPGVGTQGAVKRFARRVSGIYGAPLTIGTGTHHSQRTVNGNVSDHWEGNAVDIPASGRKLIQMGRAALQAAGMPRSQARKAKGGLYNIHGHQIIFGVSGVQYGGDHTDHLHISV